MKEAIDLVKSKGGAVESGKTTPSGLWFLDIVEGEGANPQKTSNVKVHYTGWLPNGTKFDSSHDHGAPASFRLNQVISGWTEGVAGMKKGGQRYLVLPPDLGYGRSGSPPVIPPNATLVFMVELIDFE